MDSSIWLESESTRLVWLTMIAVMDEDGFVAMAAPLNLARRANVDLDKCEHAIAVLEAPDPNSSDPDNEGRRVERVPGGWIVLNAQKYREAVTRQVDRENGRRRAQKFRDAKRKQENDLLARNAGVTPRNASGVTSNASEAEAYVRTDQDQSRDLALREQEAKIVSTISEHRALMDFYHDGFVARFGDKPDIKGSKDGATISRLLKTYGFETVRERLQRYLDSDDPFIRQAGYTIGVFSIKWDSLTVAKAEPHNGGTHSFRTQTNVQTVKKTIARNHAHDPAAAFGMLPPKK